MLSHIRTIGLFIVLSQAITLQQAQPQVFSTPMLASNHENGIYRCRREDVIPTNHQVLQRLEWAEQCDILPKTFFTNAKFQPIQEDGRDSYLTRSLYWFPSFAYRTNVKQVWKPNIEPLNGVYDCTIPDNVIWYTTCAAGCFLPSTKLAFAEQEISIEQALQENKQNLLILDASQWIRSKLLGWKSNYHLTFIHDEHPTLQTILTLQLDNGRRLHITPEHVLVDADGALIRAQELKEGAYLLSSTLEPVQILKRTSMVRETIVMHVTAQATSQEIQYPLFTAEGILSAGAEAQTSTDLQQQRLMLRSSRISPIFYNDVQLPNATKELAK